MTAYTPGPWTYEYDNHGNGGFWEWYNIETANDHIGRADSEDDARLIVAAPDLLEVSKNATSDIQQVLDAWEQGDLAGAVHGLEATVSALHAAVAKATVSGT